MARALARDLGVRLRFIDSSFARLIDDVTQDRCDVAMFAIGITPQRSEKLRFTRPHLVSDIYAITSKSNRLIKTWDDIDRPGVVVAVAKGTLHEPVMREKLKHATLLVTATTQGREQENEIRSCRRVHDRFSVQPTHAGDHRLGAPGRPQFDLSPDPLCLCHAAG